MIVHQMKCYHHFPKFLTNKIKNKLNSKIKKDNNKMKLFRFLLLLQQKGNNN